MARQSVQSGLCKRLMSFAISVLSTRPVASPSSRQIRVDRSLISRRSPPNPNRRGALPIMEGEKKRIELQNRVYRARLIIPMHIPFRVFEDLTECVEAEEIVKRLVFPS